MNDSLKNPATYISREGHILTIDYCSMLADMTGTRNNEWEEAEGPDSGCGISYYYQHDVLGLDARINNDQGMIQIVVTDEEGNEVAEASLESFEN